MSIKDSVVTAARSRLRPILMTTLTTVLGMIPMAIGNGEGAELWNGLGVTVAWGLSISTLITLVLIPVIYTSFATIFSSKGSSLPKDKTQVSSISCIGRWILYHCVT